jgi:hypothetical protein
MDQEIFIAHNVDIEKLQELSDSEVIHQFCQLMNPIERPLLVFADGRTDAVFSECHVSAEKLVQFTTPDTPLDPDASADYRANRDLVEDHAAFEQMVADAKRGRTFSNIVCEFIPGDEKPLKVVGGQHRFAAIQEAYKYNTNANHGIKVYFSLDKEQRLDVQVISNTNIEVSRDLLDRMYDDVLP